MNPVLTWLNDNTKSPLVAATKGFCGLGKAQTTAALTACPDQLATLTVARKVILQILRDIEHTSHS